MRRLFVLWVLVIVAGCAAPPPKEDIVAPAPPKPVQIESIDFEGTTDARLFGDTEGTQLKVGDAMEDVTRAFPKGKGGGGFQDVPPTLEASRFNVWGWQEKDGSGFGAILDKQTGRLVAAMRTKKNLSQPDLDKLHMRYVGRFGESLQAPRPGADGNTGIPKLSNSAGSYSFWEFEGGAKGETIHRIMLCAVTNKQGGYTVTVAMGDAQVMNALDASEAAAERNLRRAEALLNESAGSSSPSGS